MLRAGFGPTLALLLSGMLVSCGSSDSEPQATSQGKVEIFSWWVQAGEKEALDAMLAIYLAEHPGVEVINTVQPGSLDAAEELRRRLLEGQPPDTFQTTAGNDLLQWVTRGAGDDAGSLLEPLDFLFDEHGLRTKFVPSVLEQLAYNGHLYAVPVNAERVNTLFYNKQLFAANQLSPPRTLDELLSACQVFKGKGITPLALGTKQFWGIGVLLWYDILIAQAGPQYYLDFFTGKKSAEDPMLRQALTKLLEVLACANTDASSIGWSGAADRVHDGKAAMTMVGDWVKGYYNSKGWKSDVDFGVVPSPGTGGVFIFGSDTFCLPRGAPNRSDAIALLETFSSAQAQVEFNLIKGSIPARIDSDLSRFDSISQATLRDFQADKVLPILEAFVPADFVTAVQDSLNTFASDGSIENEIRFIENRYQDLKTQ